MSAEPNPSLLEDERAQLRELILEGLASPVVPGTAAKYLARLNAELDQRAQAH